MTGKKKIGVREWDHFDNYPYQDLDNQDLGSEGKMKIWGSLLKQY